MYKVGSFELLDKIAVLCRGQSVACVKKYNDFDQCYIVGQFDRTLDVLGKYLKGKKIVQVINKSTIKISKKIHNRFDVDDIQCNFTGWLDRPLSPARQKIYKSIKKQNSWASVHLAPPGIRERRPCDKNGFIRWETTGLFAVDLATFWQPKEVWIFGLDFYSSSYFRKEKVSVDIKKNKKRKKSMLYNFNKIVERDDNIHFSIFTKCRGIKSNSSNLTVTYI